MNAPAFPRTGENEGLANALSVLRRRLPVVLTVIIACVVVAIVHHKGATKSYVASASVAFQSGTLSDAALQLAPSGGAEPQREANTEVLVAHSPEVAKGVAAQLKLTTEPSELLKEVQVEAAANADVLNVVATTHNPRYSVLLANTFAEQYIAFKARQQLASIAVVRKTLEEQLAALPAGSAGRATLEQSLQRVGELRAVAGGGANVIGLARQAKPAGTGLMTTIVLAIVIGLALAFTIVFLLESLDRRIKSIEEFEQEYRMPALAGIPQSAFRVRRAADRDELEPYRILRSALDFVAAARELDTLLVTSAISGEGKTTVAVDLAHVVALARRRVVLVELDLRRPTFAQHFNLDANSGLSKALTRRTPVSELLVEPFADLPNLSVLPAGLLPHNPAELLGSPAISDILAELSGDGTMVIVDAPPLNPVADTHVLLGNPAIDGTIIVARLGRTTRDDVRRARVVLDRQMVQPVGIVVTGVRDAAQYENSYDVGGAVGEVTRLPESNGGGSNGGASSRTPGRRLSL
jgi:polysaccharide biosynthesis transport protein